GPELRMAVAHRRYGLVDLFLGRRPGFDLRAVRRVVTERDVGAHHDGRRIPEGLAFLELSQLRIGPIDRLDTLGIDDLAVRLIHQVVRRVLPEMLLAVRTLVHPARRFSWTEAGNL